MNRIIIALSLLSIFYSCKKERPQLEPASSKIEGIQDQWVLSKVIQVDVLTEKTRDVSSVYIGTTPMQIEFKISGNDTMYTTTPGTSINLLGNTGKWKFDDNNYPSFLTFNYDGNDNRCKLNRTVRTVDQTLEFEFKKVCTGKNVVSYNLVFNRL